MKPITFLILICLTSIKILSQSYITIKGNVVNKENLDPIEFVNISILNTNQGTITEQDGSFIFHIPDSLKNYRLIFSSIGYESIEVPVNGLKTSGQYYLKPKIYEINNITVIPINQTADEIVSSVLKRLNNNYPINKHFLNCFYREIAYDNLSPKRLIEAAIGIHNFGINASFSKDRIKINQFRKSDDNLEYSLFSKMTYKLFGESNMLYEIFESYAISNKGTFKSEYIKNKYEIDRIEMLDETPVVVLRYSDSSHRAKIKYGYLYININDYAILRSEHYITVKDKYKRVFSQYFAPGQEYLRKTIRIYHKKQEKYYLKYVEFYRSAYGTADYKKGENSNYLSQLLINDILINKKDYDRIRKKEASLRDKDLSNIEYSYYPDFWENYNILTKHGLNHAVKKELEKEKSLELQFKENSK